jgi:hypothetical protein
MNRSLLVSLFLLALSISASAQYALPVIPSESTLHAVQRAAVATVDHASLPQGFAKQTEETAVLFYHDTQIPGLLWNVPSVYSNFTSLMIGQRFTLPEAAGILDSMYVFIRQIVPLTSEIRFDVYTDTLVQRITTDTTKFHYPQYFKAPLGIRDTARLSGFDYDSTHYTKVDFNAKPITQEFHINVLPITAGPISTLFTILSDSRKGEVATITPESARSTMLINYNNQTIPLFMHGVFSQGTGAPTLAPTFYMVAFARIGTATGMETVAIPSNPELAQNFPNPVDGRAPLTTIAFETATTGHATLEVFDAIGRSVATLHDGLLAAGRHSMVFRTAGLAPGMYNYRLTLDGRQAMRRMLVLK